MRRTVCLAVLAASLVLVPAAGASTPTGRLLVSVRPAASAHGGAVAAAALTAVAARSSARIAGPVVPEIGLLTVRPRPGESLAALQARLERDPRVRAVSPDRRATPRAVPDDPALSLTEPALGTPAGTPVQWWAYAEHLPQAWDVTTGEGARVAIIDTGAQADHPELAGRIVYANDLGSGDRDAGAGTDEEGHGTHVSSLACATAGNGIGLAGAGYRCSLLIEKTDFSDASIAAALVDAARHRAQAINMSFGTDGSAAPGQALVDALHYARRRGAVLVAAAADEDTQEQGDPANVLQPTGTGPQIDQGIGLSVTAARYGGERAPFGGEGSQISLAAYGAFQPGTGRGPRGLLGALPAAEVGIERPDSGPPARPGCGCRTTFQGDDRYAYLSGTSMAAPQVAAIAALMRNFNPGLTPAAVERMIKTTASRPAGTGWTEQLGWGVLDGGAALAAAARTDATAPVSRLRVLSRSRRTLTVRITAMDGGPEGVRVSGLKGVELWQRTRGRWHRLRTTRARTVRLHPSSTATVVLRTQAVDRAGNREVAGRLPSVRSLPPR